jgi:Ca2+-binding RTX toxin-like protein
MADIIGTPGDDELPGTNDPDTISGLDGNDFIFGLGGDDIIDAGDGDDQATGGQGNDTLTMGDGNDFGIGNAGDDIIFGGEGNDNLFGELSGETENGVTGNDQLFGGGGDDFMRGGLGDDYLDGGTGSDRASYFSIPGAVRVDLRIQGVAQNTLAGGFDTLVNVENVAGSEFADVLIGNHLANWIWSHGGADDITGNAGDDTFWIPDADGAIVRGGQGVDVISFRGRVDTVGTDTGGVSFTLASTSAQDTGRGFVTATQMEGAEGSEFDDSITGNGQDNLLSGFTGNDTVNGGGGDDLIYGDHALREVGENQSVYNYDDPAYVGNDVLNGGGGEDLIFGNAGDDVIDGGTGGDTIVGGLGADTITGGGGDDQFVYTAAAESSSVSFDTIVNGVWNNGDVFDLTAPVTSYATLAGGQLDAASFDADLGAAMSSILAAGRAVLFTASTGSYAGQRFLVVDGDGAFGYTPGADYVFLMQGSAASFTHLGIDDFI